MTTYNLNTEPAQLTVLTLTANDVRSLYSRIVENSLSLYVAEQSTRIESHQVELSANNDMFVFEETVPLREGEPMSVQQGTLLVINQADEACVLDLQWITGSQDVEKLFQLSPRELKSYIHPQVLQTVIVN